MYVDNVEKNLAVDWTLSAWDGSSDRYVEFNTDALPAAGADIKIAVTTEADYTVISGDQLNLRVGAIPNAEFTVYTYNDTAQQNILTKVFVGPTSEGTTTGIAFDEDGYDESTFDETVGIVIQTNNFALGRLITDPGRMVVTLNGDHLHAGGEYSISTGSDGLSILTVDGSILGPVDVLAVTMFTMSVVPDSLNFRIFQDMLGNQKILRLSNANTTELAQALAADADTVYVKDVSKLSEPNLVANIFGQLMVGGERITYRTRNTTNNSVSGLRRGTAGTSAMAHINGAVVSDAGPAQQIGSQYQETVSSDITSRGDDSTVAFDATLTNVPSSLTGSTLNSAIAVSVGGTLMIPTTDYTVVRDSATQVTVTFVTAPASGSEIDISITTGKVMYAQGASTASNGIALQEQTTAAALFLKDQG